MLPIITYDNVWSLTKDLEEGNDVFCRFGKISNLTLTTMPQTDEGYVQLYIESYERVYRESTRYAFTLDEFRKMLFSKLAYGMYYYIYVKNLGTYWDFAALPDLQQIAYNQYGKELWLKELKTFWPASIPLAPKVLNVILTAQDGQIQIDWDAVPGAESYVIYWTNIPEVTIYSNRIEDIKTNSYLLTGLQNNNEYWIRVAVWQPNGGGVYSS